jgi:hypothetical protein
MFAKVISPLGFPLLLTFISWFLLRNQIANRTVRRAKMRLWLAIATAIACGDYAIAWHDEIGSAWQHHPEFTLLATLIVFMVFNAVSPPLHSFTTFLNDEPPQHSERKVR